MMHLARSVMILAVLAPALCGCVVPAQQGAAVPDGKAALRIANRACPSYGLRATRWHIAFDYGYWTLWRFDGRQSIQIEAATGDTAGCLAR